MNMHTHRGAHCLVVLAVSMGMLILTSGSQAQSWEQVTSDTLNCRQLLYHPTSVSNKVFALTTDGVFISQDNGATWQRSDALHKLSTCWFCNNMLVRHPVL